MIYMKYKSIVIRLGSTTSSKITMPYIDLKL